MTTLDTFHPPPARTATRPTVNYHEYVMLFARSAAGYLFLTFAGVALSVGAGMYLQGGFMVFLVAAGLGSAAAGGGGFMAVLTAHAAYTRHLAVSSTTTYQEPAQPGPTVRPFVPSSNGTPTIRAGRFKLTRDEWARLFQTAGDGGRLTRDGASKVLPRPMYRDWQTTLGELQRLGIVDGDGHITPAGWEFYHANVSPYPNGDEAHAGAHSTHARRTHGAHGAGMVES